tara:strand:+ start:2288 stop:3457 length:1170 start_codon:yes stop_codon:yes gene_type:complete
MKSQISGVINHDQIKDIVFEQSLNGVFVMLLPHPVTWDGTSIDEKEQLLDLFYDNQVVAHFNPAFCEMHGLSPENALNLKPKDFYKDKSYFKEVWQQLYNDGYLKVQSVKPNFNGKTIYIDGSYRLIYSKTGEIIGHYGIQQDVTEQRNQEEALRNAIKMRDKFVDILSHDLKAPIANIISLIGLFEKAYEAKHQTSYTNELFDMLRKSSGHLNDMLHNMLIWSRSHGKRIPFNPEFNRLETVVERTIEPYVDIARSKSIELSFDSDVFSNKSIYVDIDMLHTILSNLIVNAIKFTPNHGEISITFSEDESYDIIAVTDNGVGIKPTRLKTLFKVGENISKPGTNGEKGSGLGLLIIDDFIKRHQGKIDVQSELGKGSTFKCYFPKKSN